MGLVNLPVLNRLGFSNSWNVNIVSKKLELTFFFFFYLIKMFFSLFFFDCFFYLFKKKIKYKNFFLFYFKNNIVIGQIYLLKIEKWSVLFINYFLLVNKNIKFFFKSPKSIHKIFFIWKKKLCLNYKHLF